MNTANSTIPDETPEWEENEDELAYKPQTMQMLSATEISPGIPSLS